MDEYEKHILSLTNKARQQPLSEIEVGVVRSDGQIAELRTENARLQHIAEEGQANAERWFAKAEGLEKRIQTIKKNIGFFGKCSKRSEAILKALNPKTPEKGAENEN